MSAHGEEFERLEAAQEHWDGLLEAQELSAADLAGLSADLADRGQVVDGRPLCNVLRPHLLTRGLLERQSTAANQVVAAAGKALHALLADEQLSQLHLGRFSDWIGDVLEMEPRAVGQGSLVRLDAALARTRLHFVEINADTPLGAGHNDAIADFFCGLDVFEEFSQRYEATPMRMEPAMLETALSVWRRWGGAGKPKVTIVRHIAPELIASSARVDVENYRRHGLEAELCDAADLSFDGRRLLSPSGPVDLVHRIVPIAACLAAPDVTRPLIEAERAGAVCMLNPFRSELLGHKTLFALISDPDQDFGLTAAERRAVREHVPWGRPLRDGDTTDASGKTVDLVAHVLKNRERLVVKPAHSYGGLDVQLGWRQDQSQWENTISDALEGDFVVQQRVELHRRSYPTLDAADRRQEFFEDTDPFLFEGRLGGMLSRLSPGEITNVHAGGGVVPTFVVEPRA
ncbi:MAG: hypothetical protein ACR2N5_04780 [Solirubrobacterales bacterium]